MLPISCTARRSAAWAPRHRKGAACRSRKAGRSQHRLSTARASATSLAARFRKVAPTSAAAVAPVASQASGSVAQEQQRATVNVGDPTVRAVLEAEDGFQLSPKQASQVLQTAALQPGQISSLRENVQAALSFLQVQGGKERALLSSLAGYCPAVFRHLAGPTPKFAARLRFRAAELTDLGFSAAEARRILALQPCLINWGDGALRGKLAELCAALTPPLPSCDVAAGAAAPDALRAAVARRPQLLFSASSVQEALCALCDIGAAEGAAQAAAIILEKPHLTVAGERARRLGLCLRMFGHPATAALSCITVSHTRLLWRLCFLADGGHGAGTSWGMGHLMKATNDAFSKCATGDPAAFDKWRTSAAGVRSYKLACARFDAELLSHGVKTKHGAAVARRDAQLDAAAVALQRRAAVYRALTGYDLPRALSTHDAFSQRNPENLLVNGAALLLYGLCTREELAARPAWLVYSALGKTLPRVAFLEAQAQRDTQAATDATGEEEIAVHHMEVPAHRPRQAQRGGSGGHERHSARPPHAATAYARERRTGVDMSVRALLKPSDKAFGEAACGDATAYAIFVASPQCHEAMRAARAELAEFVETFGLGVPKALKDSDPDVDKRQVDYM